MKNKQLYAYLCATGISFCLGLGAVGSMVTGLELSVKLGALAILCLLLAAVIAGLSCLRYGSLIVLGFLGVCLLNADFLIQFKTLAAAVALRLRLAYDIPTPEFLQGQLPEQVLPALCIVAALIMIATDWSVQKQKTSIPAAVLSLLPLACCVTVTDTVPDSPWLFLWGLGLVILLMTHGIRQKSVTQANRLTAILLIPAVLMLLLLFRIIPRNAPDHWSITQLPQRIFSYFSDTPGPELDIPVPEPDIPVSSPTVDLSALDRRGQNRTPVMEVKAEFTETLYLRGRDYDEYTGTAWNSTEGRTEILYGYDPWWHEQDGAVEISLRHSKDFYYLPAMTQKQQLIIDGQARNSSRDTYYLFDHCSMRSDWRDNWADYYIDAIPPRYLELPDSTLQGAWAYLNHRKPPDMDLYDYMTPDRVKLIGQWLREHVPYDLSTPKMPSDEQDLALWFLNEAESGYCVHYATTAVVLLRACGIPARYVEGYTIPVQAGKTVTVRELHAHAWAEYYVAGVGWLVLETTPSGSITVETPSETVPVQNQLTTAPTTASTTTPTTASTTVSTTAPTTASSQTEQPPIQTVKTPPAWIKPLLLTVLWSLIGLVALRTQYQLRRKIFRQAHRRGKPNQRALVIYRRLCRLSKWTGRAVPIELTQLAQKARFSNHSLTLQELYQLQSQLKLDEASLSQLPPAKRLCAKWLFARY